MKPEHEKNVPAKAVSKPGTSVEEEGKSDWEGVFWVGLGLLSLRALNKRNQPEQSMESAL